jgi:hypothetical protein
MKKTDRVMRDFVQGGWNVGLVTAIRDLLAADWTVQQIAAQMPVLQKHAGNEAIRAAGLNGGPRVDSLYEHMETYGGILAFRLRELRTMDISTN